MAADPAFDEPWREWIRHLRRKIGMVDLADLIYVNSAYYETRGNRDASDAPPDRITLFGEREGRIALANRRKDPLMLFNSLHRHLGYPAVPRPEAGEAEEDLVPAMARRLEQLEKRIKLLEEEQRGGIDLTKFYGPPNE